MATLVCFHAHPDDEAIATAGVMALAADAGHRVVLVVATRGEQGEPAPGVLRPDEPLWQRRVQETARSAEILGARRHEFLGYVDSGMMGEPTNDDPACFWQADVEEAATRLAKVLAEESVDVLTIYDDHGLYGHPDHIQVYRVGKRAAELVGLPPDRVLCSTMNRARMHEFQELEAEAAAAKAVAEAAAAAEVTSRGGQSSFDPDAGPSTAAAAEEVSDVDFDSFGLPEDEITHAIDVRSVIDRKRQSMQAHRSQIAEDAFFLQTPSEIFERAFGTEWFASLGPPRRPGAPFVPALPVVGS